MVDKCKNILRLNYLRDQGYVKTIKGRFLLNTEKQLFPFRC